MALKHSVYDTDAHFSINPITRALTNEASSKTNLIQLDHNSERFTFEIPRYTEGHDMSQCNSIQVHYTNIDSQTKAQSQGVYEVDDMQISKEDDSVLILSWLISQNATQYVGSLNFLIRFACLDDNGKVVYVWNTAVYTGISVSSGIYNGEAVVEQYADVLNGWLEGLVSNQIIDLKQTQIGSGDGGINIWTATFGDGRTTTLQVRNGSKGDKGDMPNFEDLGAAPESHLYDKDNPHDVTIEQIGAAPGSYVTQTLEPATESEFEQLLSSIITSMDDGTALFVKVKPTSGDIFGGHTCLCQIFKHTDGYASVSVTSYGNPGNRLWEKSKYDNVWNPIEWVNPPMVVGTEYRTTERYTNKAVYTKLIWFGTLPNAGEKSVEHGGNYAINPIRVTGWCPAVSGVQDTMAIPYKTGWHDISISATSSVVCIVSKEDASAMSAYAQIWYTKQ